jgi:hypothetical protein
MTRAKAPTTKGRRWRGRRSGRRKRGLPDATQSVQRGDRNTSLVPPECRFYCCERMVAPHEQAGHADWNVG